MKIYRILHIPTGLYFRPSSYRRDQLHKKGKIYTRKPSLSSLTNDGLTVHLYMNEKIISYPLSDFVLVEGNAELPV